jgi:hypothetical protein
MMRLTGKYVINQLFNTKTEKQMNQMRSMNNGSELFAGQRAMLEMSLGQEAKLLKQSARMAPAARRFKEDGFMQILSPQELMEREEALQQYVHAAFCFVHGLLWNGQRWDDKELRKALGDLQLFFKHTGDREGAFVTLAGRAMVATILGGKLERMKLWACLMHPSGLCSEPELGFSRQHAKLVKKSPVYQVGLPILIRYYLQYVDAPSADIIMSMKSELDNVEFGELMQVFYDVVNAKQPEI